MRLHYKKSDADMSTARMQVLLYLYILKQKGVNLTGKIQVFEKKTQSKSSHIVELTPDAELELLDVIADIENRHR